MEIHRLEPGDEARVVASSHLFDRRVRLAGAAEFLARPGHHLLVATVDGADVGFVSGVETSHPDKGTEMLLYELGVAEDQRRKGIGRALVEALVAVARGRGCYGMWVATETDNVAALATYRSAGAAPPDAGVTLTWSLQDG